MSITVGIIGNNSAPAVVQDNKAYQLEYTIDELGVPTFEAVTQELLFNFLVAQELEISEIQIPIIKIKKENDSRFQLWIFKDFGKGNTADLIFENVYFLIDNIDKSGLADVLNIGNRTIVDVYGNADIYFDENSINKHYTTIPQITANTAKNFSYILASNLLKYFGEEIHFTNIASPRAIGKLIIPEYALEVPLLKLYYNGELLVNYQAIEINLLPDTTYRLINCFGYWLLLSTSISKFENPLVYKLPNPVVHTGNTVETRLISVDIGKITPSTIVSIKDLVFTSNYNGITNSTGNIIIRVRISDTDTIDMNENNNLSNLVMANNNNYFDAWAKMERTYTFSVNLNDGSYNLYRMANISANSDVQNSFNNITYPSGYFENNKFIHITAELPAASPNSITVRSCIIYKY